MAEMRDRMTAAMAVLLLILCVSALATGYGGDEQVPGGGETGSRGLFIMERSDQVVKTDGGEVRVLKGFPFSSHRIHIGFISMEPNTLFIPQYLDASFVFFVRRGEVRVGWIYKDKMVEKQMKSGDINRIPAGSTFYMVNTGKGQRLQIICAIDTSESLGLSFYQPFFVGGGLYPPSVLAGFDIGTLATAFNESTEETKTILAAPVTGPIVYMTGEATERPQELASIMHSKVKALEKKAAARYGGCEDDEAEQEEDQIWPWRKLLNSILGAKDDRQGKKGGAVSASDPYNLYDRKADYRNKYGWTIALDDSDFKPLAESGIGVYLVNLTAGSMLAPHVNPTATEYGVVLAGAGTVQVVFPNGTTAMNAEVREGDVFWVPRYFPFCQIAGRGGPMELFGFTTSARPNHPQFLAGVHSVLQSMMGPELAAGFGTTEERLQKFLSSQEYDVILPPWPPAGNEPGLIEMRTDI